MTIVEAMKASREDGHEYRRLSGDGHGGWLRCSATLGVQDQDGCFHQLTAGDLMADDWVLAAGKSATDAARVGDRSGGLG